MTRWKTEAIRLAHAAVDRDMPDLTADQKNTVAMRRFEMAEAKGTEGLRALVARERLNEALAPLKAQARAAHPDDPEHYIVARAWKALRAARPTIEADVRSEGYGVTIPREPAPKPVPVRSAATRSAAPTAFTPPRPAASMLRAAEAVLASMSDDEAGAEWIRIVRSTPQAEIQAVWARAEAAIGKGSPEYAKLFATLRSKLVTFRAFGGAR